MPLRKDFDIEHDNDAELILADMEFTDDDHKSEIKLKLDVLHSYNHKLNKREERKEFVISRHLLDYRHHQALDRRRPKDERDIHLKMRVFARFLTPAGYEKFIQGLVREQRIRKRIAQLQHYRDQGITTIAESEEYEREKKKEI